MTMALPCAAGVTPTPSEPAASEGRWGKLTAFAAALLLTSTSWSGHAAAAETADEAALRVRGLEHAPRRALHPARAALATVGYVPGRSLDALLYGAERGAATFGTEEFILRAREFFYLIDDELAWYPSFSLSSGYTPLVGAGLAGHRGETSAAASGAYNNGDKWQLTAHVNRRWQQGKTAWDVTLTGVVNRDDDLQFFGFGANPGTDPRSFFLPEADDDHATYRQRRRQVGLVIAASPTPIWQTRLTSYYQRREVLDLTGTHFAEVFDVATLPGARRASRQWYSELALVLDTRQPLLVSPGVRLEGYSGLSLDTGGDDGDYWRGGLDGAVFLPIIRRNRLLVARLALDAQRQRHGVAPLAFTEYLRHPRFRGVSSRKVYRTDERSLLSSLEYQWPVGPTFGGHLFVDHLMVADDISDLSLSEAAWATGFGVDFHVGESGLGGLQFVTGTEGFRLLLSAGFDGGSDMRADQK